LLIFVFFLLRARISLAFHFFWKGLVH
jgi:hypothetical protein